MKTITFLIAVTFITFGFVYKHQSNPIKLKTTHADTQYVCLPCGSDCDNIIYKKPGTCPHCMMKLVDKASVKFNNIAPDGICDFIKDIGEKNVILLDVRTAEEFNGKDKDKFGKLKGAINIPVQDLEKRIGELKQYKNKDIIVYCSHSHRSPQASYILTQHGFKKVTNMEFGMSQWKEKVKAGDCSNKLYVKQ
ncbi:MAG: rhodanese-like domain-containing protein [Ferruginibacter sp.]